MVNLEGFKDLVDAVGGVELNVRQPIPVGLPHEKTFHYIDPGKRTLDGHDTLWFARAREGSDDYSRMARQKCVMSAMLQQVSPQVALRNFEKIAGASSAMVSTDIPRGEVDRFVELALKAKSQKIATLSLVPPMINTANPDIALVQEKVAAAIARAEGRKPGRRRRPRPLPPRRRPPPRRPRPRRRPRLRRRPAAPATPERPGRGHRRLGRLAGPGLRRQPVGGPRRGVLIADARRLRATAPRVYAVTTTGPLPRIVAVVVTFNRLGLLQTLVDRLGEIDGLGEVLVVDNASSDGTGEWLDARGHTGEIPLRSRTLSTNRGGAGGFHDGLAWAIDREADLVWLMDDDGLPDLDCLAHLLEEADNLDFWGPLVVDEADPGRLVFPIRLPGGTRVVHAVDDVRRAAKNDRIDGIVIPFNGVLVTKELVDRIGLPREEFFIWGDDHEYRLRAEEAGARVATVVTATVRHPSVGNLGTPMMFGRTTYNDSPSDLKHYCMARNNLVNLRDYRGPLHAAAFVVKTAWFYTFTQPEPVAAAAQPAGHARRHRRRLRGPPEVPVVTGPRDGRGRGRDPQPRRPARRHARRARRPDARARRGHRRRQRQHRPHARGALPEGGARRPAARGGHAGQPRRRRRLPPRGAGGVRPGASTASG